MHAKSGRKHMHVHAHCFLDIDGKCAHFNPFYRPILRAEGARLQKAPAAPAQKRYHRAKFGPIYIVLGFFTKRDAIPNIFTKRDA